MVHPHDSISILVVESQPLIREALTRLLNTADGLLVVGSVGVATEVAPAVQIRQPDVAIFRFDPTHNASVALLEELPRVSAHTPPLVITATADVGVYARTVELGAMGVLSCEEAGDVLIKAVRKVHAGELWLDRARAAGVVARLTRGLARRDPEMMKIESLTPRQREIVELVAEGLTNKQLADRLFISEATARNHITAILDKLEVRDRFQLAVFAFRRGLVTCPQTPAAVLRMRAMR